MLQEKPNYNLAINSTLSFVLAYLLVFFLNDVSVAFLADHYQLRPEIYLSQLKYWNYGNWSPHIVKRVFFYAPLLNVVVFILAFVIFMQLRKINSWMRFFLLWLGILSICYLVGKMISVPLYEGQKDPERYLSFGLLSGYFFMPDALQIAIAVAGAVIVFVLGLLLTKPFLRTAETKKDVKKGNNRKRYMRLNIVLPFIFGVVGVVIVHFPFNLLTNGVTFLACSLLLMAAYIGTARQFRVLLYQTNKKQTISVVLVVSLAAFIGFYRFVYINGIQF